MIVLPTIVSAATIALITASSVAQTVASERSSMRRLEGIWSDEGQSDVQPSGQNLLYDPRFINGR